MDEASRLAMDDACAQLTDVQQTCLRLVTTGLTSKEIAKKTGLTYRTVDQYLSRATVQFGAMNRREAARRFAAWEEFNKLQLQSGDLADAQRSAIVEPSAKPMGWPRSENPKQVMRDSAANTSVSAAGSGWPLVIPPVGGEANGLTRKQRIYAVLRITGFSAIAMLAIVLVLTGTLNLLA